MNHDNLVNRGSLHHHEIDNALGAVNGGYLWAEMRRDNLAMGVGATAIPGLATWKTSMRARQFANAGGEYLYFDLELPHDWMEGTSIWFHCHFMSAVPNTKAVTWRLVTTTAAKTAVFGSEVAYDSTYTHSGTTANGEAHLVSTSKEIPMTGLVRSCVIGCRIERVTGSHTAAANLLFADFHYRRNKFGSTTEV